MNTFDISNKKKILSWVSLNKTTMRQLISTKNRSVGQGLTTAFTWRKLCVSTVITFWPWWY